MYKVIRKFNGNGKTYQAGDMMSDEEAESTPGYGDLVKDKIIAKQPNPKTKE